MTKGMKCAYCGKPIKKATTTVQLEKERTKFHQDRSYCRYVYPDELNIPWPKTMADCQRLSNQKVISIKRGAYYAEGPGGYTREHSEQVSSFAEWDGEHYRPCYGYFCSNNCAGWYARKSVDHRRNAARAEVHAPRTQSHLML